jgi:acetoin utilization deacetylase AcuC-like enzyme
MTNTMALLESSGLLEQVTRIDVREAAHAELSLAHRADYVDAVREAARAGGGWVDPDTLITPRSYDVAARVVGGTLSALDAVLRGDVASSYCLVRPPGHHATPSRAMGFCLFNHVAVAAAWAIEQRGMQRVAIIDIDVHHGNGTQDAFWSDGRVLYASTHEYPFYPGTGAADEIGEGTGRGTTVNIPMPHGSGDAEHLRAFDDVIAPAVRRFRPELLLVSSGFDAHYADEIAMQQMSVDGYGALASRIIALADELCGGRVLFAQEGGYHPIALPWCVRRTIELLRGDDPTPDPLGPIDHGTPAGFDAMLAEVKKVHAL